MSNLSQHRGAWSLLNQMAELDQLFNQRMEQHNQKESSVSDWVPAVDIKEEATQFLIHADLPGIPPEEIKIHVENGYLSIEGEKLSESKSEKENYKRVERSYGNFYRRFNLPDTADLNSIKERTKYGVLEIAIPKIEKAKPRQIEVLDDN